MLQKIQSLENFVSMAIQGTQVLMYTNIHCFCIFQIFKFYFYFYVKNKINQNWKENKQKQIKQEQSNA